jgi:Ca2+-dependent lipid-binding protein
MWGTETCYGGTMPQAVEDLVFEDDYQPSKSRRPVVLEEISTLFHSRWCKTIVGVLATLIVAWALATLWFLTPIFG